MAITGLNLNATRIYVSDYDPTKGTPEEAKSATKWKIGTLDSRVQGYLKDMATKFTVSQSSMASGDDSVETSVSQAEQNFERVRFGLKGWDNFQDSDGNDIKYTTRKKQLPGSPSTYNVVPAELIALIPEDIVTELSFQIRQDQEMRDEQKNG